MFEPSSRSATVFKAVKTGAMSGLQLAVEICLVVFGRAKKVAVQSREIAGDALARHDALDAIDRRGVALGGEPRAALAMEPLEIHEAIVQRIDEVRRRRAGLPAADRAVFDDHHRFPNLGKQISSGESGDTSADDANISRGVEGER
jgi:hypothetical protein